MRAQPTFQGCNTCVSQRRCRVNLIACKQPQPAKLSPSGWLGLAWLGWAPRVPAMPALGTLTASYVMTFFAKGPKQIH